jgi:hypothetical protein
VAAAADHGDGAMSGLAGWSMEHEHEVHF